MCDRQRQQFRDGVTMPCAVPECLRGWLTGEIDEGDEGDGDRYTRECFLPSPGQCPNCDDGRLPRFDPADPLKDRCEECATCNGTSMVPAPAFWFWLRRDK